MNVEYIRNLNHNYIKILSEDDFFEYQIQMLSRNNISGLLKFSDERIDNTINFLYEINSKQPFVQVFERQKMNYEAFLSLITCLKNVANNIGEYLLDFNSIVMLPEFIYMNPETKDIQLIYLPGTWQDIKSEFHELSRKLLDWIDYKDEAVVSAAYDLFRQTAQENYSLEEILENISANKFEKQQESTSVISNKELYEKKNYTDEKKITEGENFDMAYIEEEYEDFEYEDEDIKERSSVIKKISDSILAAEQWFKKLGFTNKDEEEEDKYNDIIDDVVTYGNYSENVRGYGVLQEEETGYGNTVLFSDVRKENKCLRPCDNGNFPTFKLNIYPFIIGKLQEAVDGVIEDDTVSRIHAKIEKSDSQYYLVDLNSTNGTYLNGKLISPNEKTKLNVGDKIQFGLIEYTFENQ